MASRITPRRPVARVAKIKRAELEAALDDGRLVARDETTGGAPATPGAAPETQEQPGALDRLLEATNSRLEAPELSRRRSAIQRLRHAVRATVAEGGRRLRPESDGTAYRDDLAHAMQAEARPAPLKLVPTQRVDQPAAETQRAIGGGPVRPRRPGAAPVAEAPQVAKDGFARIVSERGLRDMDDVLEAAAAHAGSAEEGATRREVMALAARGAPDLDWSRENGLRAFGKLLREGRIVKLRRGRFAAAQTSRYAS